MKAHLDCVPCIVSQSLRVARLATDDPEAHRRVMEEVLAEMARLTETDLDCTPFELGQVPQQAVAHVTGEADPYVEVRRESNEQALDLYPDLREIVSSARDGLLTGAKIAVAGNIIDLGAVGEDFDVEETVWRVLEAPFARNDYELFRTALSRASTVLYLADNAGEIVFDRALMGELPVDHIVRAVKAQPFINDAMLDDAIHAGVDEVAEIIQVPLYPERCAALDNAWEQADVIISKGQANYETYSEAEGPLFFLLIAKCELTADDTGVEKGEAVLLSREAELRR